MTKEGTWSKVGVGILDGAFNVAETTIAGVQGARNVATGAARTVLDATGEAIDHVATAAGEVGGKVGDATHAAAGAAARPFQNSPAAQTAARPFLRAASTFKRRYGNAMSPAVVGQGGDFGNLAPGQDPVILRIEVANSSDVKTMRRLSWIIALFALGATVSTP
jgi:hypothetical protein